MFMGLPLSLKPFESFTLAGLVLAAIIGCHFLAIRTVALSSPHDPQYFRPGGKVLHDPAADLPDFAALGPGLVAGKRQAALRAGWARPCGKRGR